MKIKELFDVQYGINLELVNCEMTSQADPDGVNFVARTALNNGVVGRVKRINGKKPQPAGALTCAGGGSVLSTFVQTQPFYSGRDLYVLTPKQKMTKNEKLFYCMCIKNNAYRYNYGRQANRTMPDIDLPDIVPSYVNRIDVKSITTDISPSNIKLNMDSWKEFLLTDLFDIERGTRLTKENRLAGNVPLVTAGFQNEGIADIIFTDQNKIYYDKITIDMFGNAFFRGYEFYCDDNIIVLNNKFVANKYILLFLTTVINADKYRYSYGRQYRQKDAKSHLIKLPSTFDGTPDWDYMESYMKLLPYSDRI